MISPIHIGLIITSLATEDITIFFLFLDVLSFASAVTSATGFKKVSCQGITKEWDRTFPSASVKTIAQKSKRRAFSEHF